MKPSDETVMLMIAGPFAGDLVVTTVGEAEECERQGFAETLTGRDSTFVFTTPVRGPHKAAEAWLIAKHGKPG